MGKHARKRDEVPSTEVDAAELGRFEMLARTDAAIKARGLVPANAYDLKPLRRRVVKLIPRNAPLDSLEATGVADSADVLAGVLKQGAIEAQVRDGVKAKQKICEVCALPFVANFKGPQRRCATCRSPARQYVSRDPDKRTRVCEICGKAFEANFKGPQRRCVQCRHPTCACGRSVHSAILSPSNVAARGGKPPQCAKCARAEHNSSLTVAERATRAARRSAGMRAAIQRMDPESRRAHYAERMKKAWETRRSKQATKT